MQKTSAVIAGASLSATWLIPRAVVQTASAAANATIPPGANTNDHAALAKNSSDPAPGRFEERGASGPKNCRMGET